MAFASPAHVALAGDLHSSGADASRLVPVSQPLLVCLAAFIALPPKLVRRLVFQRLVNGQLSSQLQQSAHRPVTVVDPSLQGGAQRLFNLFTSCHPFDGVSTLSVPRGLCDLSAKVYSHRPHFYRSIVTLPVFGITCSCRCRHRCPQGRARLVYRRSGGPSGRGHLQKMMAYGGLLASPCIRPGEFFEGVRDLVEPEGAVGTGDHTGKMGGYPCLHKGLHLHPLLGCYKGEDDPWLFLMGKAYWSEETAPYWPRWGCTYRVLHPTSRRGPLPDAGGQARFEDKVPLVVGPVAPWRVSA
jgi:hypothetical protein